MDICGEIILNKYRLVRLLGEGGYGEVYEAEHITLPKKFAIKFTAVGAPEEALKNSLKEAKLLCAVKHDNVVEVIDHAMVNVKDITRAVIVMEYLQGTGLDKYLDRAANKRASHFSWEWADRFVHDVGKALSCIHNKKIVHRDLKPSNIHVVQDPDDNSLKLKILDFGISGQRDAALTMQNIELADRGTVPYMPPDIINAVGTNSGFKADAKEYLRDIYAFGIILYEILAGRKAYEAPTIVSLAILVTTQKPAPLKSFPHLANLPDEMERIVCKCIASDPKDRYQHIDEVMNDYRQMRNQITDPPPPPRRALLTIGVVFFLALIVYFIIPKPEPNIWLPPIGDSNLAFSHDGSSDLVQVDQRIVPKAIKLVTPGGREVIFRLIESTKNTWVNTDAFYLMEYPVWNELFLEYLQLHPNAFMAEQAKISLSSEGDRVPVKKIGIRQAFEFAQWMFGPCATIPSEDEWLVATGVYNEEFVNERIGPYSGDPIPMSEEHLDSNHISASVDQFPDDFSPFGICLLGGNGDEMTRNYYSLDSSNFEFIKKIDGKWGVNTDPLPEDISIMTLGEKFERLKYANIRENKRRYAKYTSSSDDGKEAYTTFRVAIVLGDTKLLNPPLTLDDPKFREIIEAKKILPP